MKTIMIIVAGYALGRITLHLINIARCPNLWKFSLNGIKRELIRSS